MEKNPIHQHFAKGGELHHHSKEFGDSVRASDKSVFELAKQHKVTPRQVHEARNRKP